MEKKLLSIIAGIIAIVVIAGSILVPTINDAQMTIGEKIEYTNSSGYMALSEMDNATVTFDNEKYLLINGVRAINPYTYWSACLVSDGLSISINGNGNPGAIFTVDAPDIAEGFVKLTANYQTSSATFENGSYTVVLNGTEYTGTYTKLFAYSQTPTSSQFTHMSMSNPAYINDLSQVYYSGAYTTGDNDTWYRIKDGQLEVSGEYTHSINFTMTKVSDTTDVYALSAISANVGDETFTPYTVLVPTTVIGHKSTGATYSLLGVIPIMVIVALLLATIQIVRSRND